MQKEEIDVMAKTIYGEARGEYTKDNGGIAPLIAIGNVILNRVANPRKKYGLNIIDTCLKPYQFSCWSKKNWNYPIIKNIQPKEDKIFDLCLEISEKLINNQWPDLTQEALHYHLETVKPQWIGHSKLVTVIGSYFFYI